MANITLIALPFYGNKMDSPSDMRRWDPNVFQKCEQCLAESVVQIKKKYPNEEIYLHFNVCTMTMNFFKKIMAFADNNHLKLGAWLTKGLAASIQDPERQFALEQIRRNADELHQIGIRKKQSLEDMENDEIEMIHSMTEESDGIVWMVENPNDQFHEENPVKIQKWSERVYPIGYMVDVMNMDIHQMTRSKYSVLFQNMNKEKDENHESYVLKMKFCTDGDFSWDEIPGVINYTAFETYEAEFKIASKEDLMLWNQSVLPKLRENLRANRMYDVVLEWLDQLENAIERNKDLELNIGGNYDGSYIVLKNTHGKLNIEVPVKADLYKRFSESGMTDYDLECVIEQAITQYENEKRK